MIDLRITNPDTLEKFKKLKEVYNEKTNIRTFEKMVELDYNRIYKR